SWITSGIAPRSSAAERRWQSGSPAAKRCRFPAWYRAGDFSFRLLPQFIHMLHIGAICLSVHGFESIPDSVKHVDYIPKRVCQARLRGDAPQIFTVRARTIVA